MTIRKAVMRRGIGKKFLIPLILITTLLVIALGVILGLQNRKALNLSLQSKGDAVADFISSFSAEYFAIFDFSDFDNIHAAVTTDPAVEYFLLLNTQNNPLSDTMKKPADVSGLYIVRKPIKDSSGAVLGTIEIGYNRKALQASIRQNSITVFFIILVSVVLLGTVITILSRVVIINRVNSTVELLKDIAEGEGDLTRRLPVEGNDEFGELSKWFNTFVDNIHKIISKLQESVDHVSTSSAELAATAFELNRGSMEQAGQTEQVASAMSEMSQTIVGVARNASDAAGAANEASDIATEGRAVVEQAMNAMVRIAETVRDASATIRTLEASSTEIGTIIQVIEEIADQTNLLALNAAIEAARAGEHGRGFAVVADEVRKLADRTVRATKEISQTIETIQADTKKSIHSMETGSVEVDTGVEHARKAMTSLDRIVHSSATGKDMIANIAAASEQQSMAAEDVTMNMESILRISQSSAAATKQIKQTSQVLENLSSELKNMAGWFRV